MRSLLLLIFMAGVLSAQNIPRQVENFAKNTALQPAQWSVFARYVNGGPPILDYNAKKNVAPASGLKLFTTALALDALGKDFRFKTRLMLSGRVHDGILDGDLLILGGGDPTLGSTRVAGSLSLDSLMQTWVNALRATGINAIKGSLIAENSHFTEQAVPGDWLWTDLGNYYAAGASGLNIHDNLYRLYFKPGRRAGTPANILRSRPAIPGLTFRNLMKTGKRGSGDNGYIYCAPKQMNATARGTIPAGVKEFNIKGAIPNPALFCLQYFKEQLQKSNIPVEGGLRVENEYNAERPLRLVASTLSPKLEDIVAAPGQRNNF